SLPWHKFISISPSFQITFHLSREVMAVNVQPGNFCQFFSGIKSFFQLLHWYISSFFLKGFRKESKKKSHENLSGKRFSTHLSWHRYLPAFRLDRQGWPHPKLLRHSHLSPYILCGRDTSFQTTFPYI